MASVNLFLIFLSHNQADSILKYLSFENGEEAMKLCVAIVCLLSLCVFGAEHPRLLFSKNDIPDLRKRITQEPVRSMFNKLKENWESGVKWGSKPSPYNMGYSAVNAAFLYVCDHVINADND